MFFGLAKNFRLLLSFKVHSVVDVLRDFHWLAFTYQLPVFAAVVVEQVKVELVDLQDLRQQAFIDLREISVGDGKIRKLQDFERENWEENDSFVNLCPKHSIQVFESFQSRCSESLNQILRIVLRFFMLSVQNKLLSFQVELLKAPI